LPTFANLGEFLTTMPCHQEPLLGTAGKSQEALAHGTGGLWWSGLDGLTINIHQHPSTSTW